MNIAYKCACMDKEATIAVADREEGQDIVDWMQGEVTPKISEHHAERSPLCQRTTMEYAKIEVDPAGGQLGTMKRQ